MELLSKKNDDLKQMIHEKVKEIENLKKLSE
jgi:hypothetical protein